MERTRFKVGNTVNKKCLKATGQPNFFGSKKLWEGPCLKDPLSNSTG